VRLPILVLASLIACNGDKNGPAPATDDTADTDDTGPELELETLCPEAEERLGYPACEHAVLDEDAFEAMTINSSTIDQIRVGKFMVPATDEARLPPVFLYVDAFPLHYDFLTTAFPDLFSGLQLSEYEGLVLHPDTREFYAGTMSLYISGEDIFYGFTVWDDPSDDTSTVTEAHVEAAWTTMQERFLPGELWWVPTSSAQIAAAESWGQTAFPIAGLELVEYEAYNPGEAYGVMRLHDLDSFNEATEAAAYGYQDILVIDEAPVDIERVVSGIVTGTRQGDLSHLNVRSSARGTPNCYILDPLEELAEWDGQLVHLECGESDWSVEAASEEDAQAWWDSIRPEPVEVCAPDLDTQQFPGLLELDVSTAEARLDNICTYGAKGSNLGTLYQGLDEQYALSGFVIPFHHYQTFIESNSWTVDLGEGEGSHTFAETLDAWHADEEFLGNASTRRDRLEALRDAMQDAPHDQQLVDDLADRIREVWGTDELMVRFRSSSNAEDSLTFSGAGLYESESICAADSYDDDDEGPSICDPDKAGEESIEEGLGNVWASLWYMAAWDERDWYSIDQSQVAMGILVNDRAKDEQVNIVAFAGNPSSADDDRYLINAQLGHLDVVSSEPGVYPEKVLLTLSDGTVTEIDRVTDSSETDGDPVLSDDQLEELGSVLAGISEVYPNDAEVPEGGEVIWDTEWKVLEDGRLIIKQIRPFLR